MGRWDAKCEWQVVVDCANESLQVKDFSKFVRFLASAHVVLTNGDEILASSVQHLGTWPL